MLKFYVPDSNDIRATARLRAIIPSKYYGTVIKKIKQSTSDDVVVISKASNINDINYLLENNIQFIFDLFDDKFDEIGLENFYKYGCYHANMITASSYAMRDLIKKKFGRDSTVIFEPYEDETKEPKFNPDKTLKILSFGSIDNFRTIPWKEICFNLRKENINFEKILLSNFGSKVDIDANIKMEIWSKKKQNDLLEWCDLVLFPFKNNHKNIFVKSPNRIVDCLNCGRYVVTNYGIDAYREFSNFVHIDKYEQLSQGIKMAIDNPNQVLNKIEMGQRYILQRFSPKHISNEWKTCYTILKGKGYHC